MKYFIEIQSEKKRSALTKAVLDCEKIMKEEGYHSVLIGNYDFHRFHLYDLFFFLNCFKLKKIKAQDIIVVRSPIYLSLRAHKILMCSIKRIRKQNAKVIILIHDLDSIRFGKKVDIEREKQIITMADAVIVHNSKMAEYILSTYGISRDKVIPLGLFDYLFNPVSKTESRQKTEKKTIVIAGNLDKNKAGYIYKLKESELNYRLYGNITDRNILSSNMEYEGSFDPDIIPNVIQGDFGLVWDGDSTELCNGPLGDYLRINNPHKCSLYIAGGLPIIIWKEAALAEFVVQNEIGITVDSLKDIGNRVNYLSEEEYQKMKEKILAIGKNIQKGLYLKTALKRAEGVISADTKI